VISCLFVFDSITKALSLRVFSYLDLLYLNSSIQLSFDTDFKSWKVLCGYSQIYWVNNFETYSPTVIEAGIELYAQAQGVHSSL
jgi:hypothetical protein